MHGFILSQHWRDTQNGLQLQYWLSTDSGPRCLSFEKQKVVLFCAENQVEHLPDWPELEVKASHLKHFSGSPVAALYCHSYQTLHQLRQHCQESNISLWEAEIKPTERFMMERFIKGSLEFKDDHPTQQILQNPAIKPSQYHPNLKLISIDIETSMPSREQAEQLFSIGFCSEYLDHQGRPQRQQRVLMVGDPSVQHELPYLQLFSNVKALLLAANVYMAQCDADVIIGWNVLNFDFTVLARIYAEQNVPFNWGRNRQNISLRQGQNNLTFADIPGRVIVDGIDALKNATYSFESFSLQYVSERLLGQGKQLQGHTANMDQRGESISELFHHDKAALAQYNLHDCELVLDIFAKTQILNYLIQRAGLTGHTLDRFGGSVAAFEFLYLPKLHRAGFIAPNLAEGFSDIKAPGGFVMDSEPGFYEDVLVLDFKSLYPSIIRTFKIDPMGLIQGERALSQGHSHAVIPGFHGAHFHRQQHFLPGIIESLWQQRDQAKADDNHATSQAIKIIMNSFYGVLGSLGCRFFDARLAASITERGHQIIQDSARWIHAQGYRVIYGDTDSVFVHIGQTDSSPQQIGRELQDQLNQYWQQRLMQEFDLPCHLEIEFESHYSRFLMPTIRGSEQGSKKRYAGLTPQGQLIFKGLEAVRSDWTPLAKSVQTQLYELVFANAPYQDFLQEVCEQLRAGLKDDDLVYRKRIRKPLDHYQKNIPPQIQAAKRAEGYYQAQGKHNPYQEGGWIQYVMTLNGPMAIECVTSPLDYQHYLDKQIAPVADGILHFLGESFDRLINPQGDIFS